MRPKVLNKTKILHWGFRLKGLSCKVVITCLLFLSINTTLSHHTCKTNTNQYLCICRATSQSQLGNVYELRILVSDGGDNWQMAQITWPTPEHPIPRDMTQHQWPINLLTYKPANLNNMAHVTSPEQGETISSPSVENGFKFIVIYGDVLGLRKRCASVSTLSMCDTWICTLGVGGCSALLSTNGQEQTKIITPAASCTIYTGHNQTLEWRSVDPMTLIICNNHQKPQGVSLKCQICHHGCKE